jgi:serine protease Do
VQIAGIAPGTNVKLEVWRNHASREMSVKLGTMQERRTASTGGSHHEGGKLGLAVRPLTADEERNGKVKGGLLVEHATGPAAEAGIQPGDVVIAANGSNVSTPEQLKSAVEKSKGHIALLIQRGETRLFVPVRVG